MSELTPAMDAALSAPAPTVFGAVEIALPGYNLRLLDGAGLLSFGGKTFVGRDPVYGTLAAIEDIGDGLSDEAPAVGLTLLPASDAAAADLAAPTMQGAPVAIYVGALDRATGAVIPDPYLLFLGEIDVPTLKSGKNSRSLEFEVVSVAERFFDDDEGARLADGFHKSVWPGENGFAFVTGVVETVYWGMDPPPGAVIAGGAMGVAGSLRFDRNLRLA
jgi:hypothetical protein